MKKCDTSIIFHWSGNKINQNVFQQFDQFFTANLFATSNDRLKRSQRYENKNINLILDRILD